MKQALLATFHQQLQLTPHLKQAISFLQLSTEELQQKVEEILASNLILESETETQTEEEQDSVVDEQSIANIQPTSREEIISLNKLWEEKKYKSSSTQETDMEYIFDKYAKRQQSLHQHLLWQLNVAPLSDQEKAIAEAIIDSINDHGFLEATEFELHAGVKALGFTAESKDIKRMIHFVQSFDPIGVGAQNVNEALMLQLNALSLHTKGLSLAKKIITYDLTRLALHHYPTLQKRYRTSAEQLDQAIKLIHSLNPHPGNMSHAEENITDHIVPDLFVRKINNQQWAIMLRKDITPRLNINAEYMRLAENSMKGDERTLVQKHFQEARWLIKCLQARNDTLLKVAHCIMKYQIDFLQYGNGAMKPLVLRDIATELNMHPSTISRMTTHKYIQTPQGTFELKYFFSSQVKTTYGSACSSRAIRSYIQAMVKEEDPSLPLSDEKITQRLIAQGIQIARRTVSKYRETLGIPAVGYRRRALITPA